MTKEKFLAFEKIRQAGVTNMNDIEQVITLAADAYDVDLTGQDCKNIMANYSKYKQMFLMGENDQRA